MTTKRKQAALARTAKDNPEKPAILSRAPEEILARLRTASEAVERKGGLMEATGAMRAMFLGNAMAAEDYSRGAGEACERRLRKAQREAERAYDAEKSALADLENSVRQARSDAWHLLCMTRHLRCAARDVTRIPAGVHTAEMKPYCLGKVSENIYFIAELLAGKTVCFDGFEVVAEALNERG